MEEHYVMPDPPERRVEGVWMPKERYEAFADLLSLAKTVEPIVRAHGLPAIHDFLLAAIAQAEGPK